MAFSAGHFSKEPHLPEPWASSDTLTKDEILSARDWELDFGVGLPRFLLDYENLPAAIPDNLQSGHVRSSVATRWDSNGNLVEESAGTLRLQRDPATQAVEGLLYEPKRTQLLNYPMDITGADWVNKRVTLSANVGTAKGQSYDSITEDTQSGAHFISDSTVSAADAAPISVSVIAKDNGAQWCTVGIRVADGGGTSTVHNVFFDLQNGSKGTTGTPSNQSAISHEIDDLGGGWYRCKFSSLLDSGFSLDEVNVNLANGDGVVSYTGDGTSGIYVMHAQAEVSREVTSPILQGGGVREHDEVDYRFSFPDVTTGVAYSIEQQAGDAYGNGGYMTFGTTSDAKNIDHGVLMDEYGLNNDDSDTTVTVARNSNDTDKAGETPLDETIDRFQVRRFDGPPTRIVRQIAIWTQTLTSTQKTDLANNYLTQP